MPFQVCCVFCQINGVICLPSEGIILHDAIQVFNILKELLVSFVFWLRQICVGAKQNDLYMASNNLFRCLKFVKMEREMGLL